MPIKRKRTKPMLAATVLIAIFGLGAGWIAGKALSGKMNHSAPASNVPAAKDSSSTSQPQPETPPPAKGTTEGSKPQPEPPAPVVKSEPQEPPKKEPDVTEIPDAEQSTKEIGRQALKKMMKEIKKMNRGNRQGTSKNENQDLR